MTDHDRALPPDASVTRLSRLINLVEFLEVGVHRNANQLAEAMNVSRRTVFRDIQTLQDAGVPIQFDAAKMCYSLQRSVNVHARPQLPDLLQTAIFIRSSVQTGAENVAAYFESEVLHRLTNNTRDLMVHALEWIIPLESNNTPAPLDYLRALFSCYVKRKKARLSYTRSSGDVQGTLFAPSQLSIAFDGFEIIGWSSFHRANIGMHVSRIVSVTEAEENFVKPDRRIGTWLRD
ncbi:helix-turn-helix transcriptional regulator [Planctomicrobium sp. SH527]|uniref:helix-turn-helix transcriptional regulator n=1 Tax=Planctomicrobium sp. SH527 TaxID=3448123 RepID=UPI003F5AECD8